MEFTSLDEKATDTKEGDPGEHSENHVDDKLAKMKLSDRAP